MRLEVFHRFMVSMMNAAESMEIQTLGNASLIFSTTFPSQLLWRMNTSAFMGDCLQALKL